MSQKEFQRVNGRCSGSNAAIGPIPSAGCGMAIADAPDFLVATTGEVWALISTPPSAYFALTNFANGMTSTFFAKR
jgi:hypothetical protein